jgi:hypothetical protein
MLLYRDAGTIKRHGGGGADPGVGEDINLQLFVTWH